ncbi:MAG TPA: alpha/beta hydrolase, partial [Roseiarcus sp.]|nr:alpha/beta hydrolase [Roseiarcus sp.]
MLVLAGLAAIYAFAVGALALGQRKLMYFPNAMAIAPAAAGLPQAQVLEIRTEDGERLLAWRIAARPGRPTILYFHGNGGGLDSRSH